MTYSDWIAAIRPKVDGTWNLHHALKGLDFFVLFSSISGVVGQYGQANYAAANTFLDAFVQYRHYLGLVASVIDLGVMEDVGFVSESPGLIDYFKFLSANFLTEEDLKEAMRLAIARSLPSKTANMCSNPSQLTVGIASSTPLTDPNNRATWKRDRRFTVYRSIQSTSDTSLVEHGGLKSFLSEIPLRGVSSLGDDATVEYLAKEIGKILYGLMMQSADDMDLDLPLSSLGLDSLVGIELRSWCKQCLGLEVSILEIMQSTLKDMGKRAVDSLIAKHQ
jgi:KR domain/Phosphopantetheine attachment site